MNQQQITAANIVYNTALDSGVNNTVAAFIVMQSAHESNSWASALYKRSNNGFGMTVPHKRKSPYIVKGDVKQPDGNSIYAAYNSLADSTRDLIHWFNYNGIVLNNIKSVEEYARVLKSKGYYGDTLQNYQLAMMRYFKTLTQFLKTNTLPVILFLIVGIVLLFTL